MSHHLLLSRILKSMRVYIERYRFTFSLFIPFQLNPGGVPTISAGEAAAFLRRSNLPVQALGQVSLSVLAVKFPRPQIWEIADFQKRGVLDKRGAFMAFKLVAAAQQGKTSPFFRYKIL